jgi:hypothetical protein
MAIPWRVRFGVGAMRCARWQGRGRGAPGAELCRHDGPPHGDPSICGLTASYGAAIFSAEASSSGLAGTGPSPEDVAQMSARRSMSDHTLTVNRVESSSRVGENPRDGRLWDGLDELHSAAALGAREDVDLEELRAQARPGDVTRSRRVCSAVTRRVAQWQVRVPVLIHEERTLELHVVGTRTKWLACHARASIIAAHRWRSPCAPGFLPFW